MKVTWVVRKAAVMVPCLLLAATAAAAVVEAPLDVRTEAQARFTAGPKVTREGETVRIAFAVSAATDVEVAVVDAKGAVVRHLAAGLLGKNAPAPFAKDALAQEIVWDGKDDLGARPAGGPFTVRVRIGSTPRLEKIVGWDGNTIGAGIVGLLVGKGGEVYVLDSEGSRGRSTLRVLDREGKYLRTIMPYPANLPKERTAGIGQLDIDGERLPLVFSAHGGNLLPLTAGMKKQNMAWHPKGFLVMASAVGTIVEHGPPRYLLALAPDGGTVEGVPLVGPKVREARGFLGGAGEGSVRYFDHLAASPDGEWVYFTSYRLDDKKPRHAVFRLKWGEAELGAPFLGKDGESGADDAHFDDPQGLATDRQSRLYVCDRGNNRVMVFDAAAKLLGTFPVDDPEQIVVHPVNGEIYVGCRKAGKTVAESRLVKFSAWGRTPPQEVSRLDIRNLDLLALDPETLPPRLWVAAGGLMPVTDKGDSFEVGAPVTTTSGLAFPTFMAADPARQRVIVDDSFASNGPLTALDLATGRKAAFAKGTVMAVDRDGNLYVNDGYRTYTVSRYDPAGKPLPFPGTGSHKMDIGKDRGYGPHLGERGIRVALNGDIYVLRSDDKGLEDGSEAEVTVFGPDGKLKKAGLVAGLGHGDCGLGVDAAGNVYVGANLKPEDQPFPRAFMGHLPAEGWVWWRKGKREVPWSYPYYNAYLYHWGSVVKFGPEGGTVYGHRAAGGEKSPAAASLALAAAPADAQSYRSGYLARELKVQGALWRYAGCGMVPTSDLNWGDPSCSCMNSLLAADEYGRVFAPNVFRFSVEMLDTNGNQIGRIGRYGNADSAGLGSKVPQPEIAFAWPAYVDVAGEKVFVADPSNRRITVVRLEWQSEATAAVE